MRLFMTELGRPEVISCAFMTEFDHPEVISCAFVYDRV